MESLLDKPLHHSMKRSAKTSYRENILHLKKAQLSEMFQNCYHLATAIAQLLLMHRATGKKISSSVNEAVNEDLTYLRHLLVLTQHVNSSKNLENELSLKDLQSQFWRLTGESSLPSYVILMNEEDFMNTDVSSINIYLSSRRVLRLGL